jgi:hypothetical protein
MENTTQPKKTNWVMIIILAVLIPILILGYKYASKKMEGVDNSVQTNSPQNNGNNSASTQNVASTQNNDFPAGTWYRNDPTVNSKYIFDAPQEMNGNLQGQVDMIDDDRSEGKVNYEVIGNGKMRISDPQNSFPAWEMGYTYNQGGQSLEIIANGHSVTYTRNPVYVPPANTPAPAQNTPASNTSSGNTSTQQNNNVNTSQLPPVGFDSKPAKPADFSGTWSNAHGTGSDKFTVTLEFQQAGSQIDGFIYSQSYDNTGYVISDIQWNFNGDINGNNVKGIIRDDKGRKISNATLSKSGNNVNFSMASANPNLPKTAKLTGR